MEDKHRGFDFHHLQWYWPVDCGELCVVCWYFDFTEISAVISCTAIFRICHLRWLLLATRFSLFFWFGQVFFFLNFHITCVLASALQIKMIDFVLGVEDVHVSICRETCQFLRPDEHIDKNKAICVKINWTSFRSTCQLVESCALRRQFWDYLCAQWAMNSASAQVLVWQLPHYASFKPSAFRAVCKSHIKRTYEFYI